MVFYSLYSQFSTVSVFFEVSFCAYVGLPILLHFPPLYPTILVVCSHLGVCSYFRMKDLVFGVYYVRRLLFGPGISLRRHITDC